MFECVGAYDSTVNRTYVREVLKACSQSAAFSGRQVVLLVGPNTPADAIDDICTLMKQGTALGEDFYL